MCAFFKCFLQGEFQRARRKTPEEGVFRCFFIGAVRFGQESGKKGRMIALRGARSARTQHGEVSFRPESDFSQLNSGAFGEQLVKTATLIGFIGSIIGAIAQVPYILLRFAPSFVYSLFKSNGNPYTCALDCGLIGITITSVAFTVFFFVLWRKQK